MSTPAIAVRDLTKRYGNTLALAGLSLEVQPGDIYGFLGPNGAGKTTTMRILSTLLRPDSGRAEVLGYDVVRDASNVRPVIGYMPDSTGAYRDMYVFEYLEFFAAAYRVPVSRRSQVVSDCVELTGLQNKRDELIEGLSRGMRQRLGLARCLIHDPQVLILDEPASGLDPRARIEIQEILKALGAMGKTILISSHILSELRNLCNKIGIVDNGRMLYSGSIDEALERARTSRRIQVRVVDEAERACELLNAREDVLHAECDDAYVWIELEPGVTDYSFVAESLVNGGLRVLSIREEEILLEDAFLRLTDVNFVAETAGEVSPG